MKINPVWVTPQRPVKTKMFKIVSDDVFDGRKTIHELEEVTNWHNITIFSLFQK